MKKVLNLFVSLSFFSCIFENNQIARKTEVVSFIKTEKNDSIISKKRAKFYRVVDMDNQYFIDTISTLTLYDEFLVDKLSMDWYLVKIDKLIKSNSQILFSSTKESSYIDFEEENKIEWYDLTLERYGNTLIAKNQKNNLLWNIYHDDILYDIVIDSVDVKKSSYLIYEWKD